MAITGKFNIHVGRGKDELVIPAIVSDKRRDLYNACSPIHEFRSSLTFEPGVPLDHDVHGAEATLAGYVRLGTHVAYIPERLPEEGKESDPPWAARLFIHVGKDERGYRSFIPQPAYAIDHVFQIMLQDAVDYILFHMSDTSRYASCESIYDGIYVDIPVRRPINRINIVDIDKCWGSFVFVKRVKG